MTKKVHELAKEMNITSKELLEKAHQLGIDVKSHMSALTDADIDKIHGAKRETKIVKAEPKKKEAAHEEPRVTVKAAVRPHQMPGRQKPPVGKPVVNKAELDNRSAAKKPPVGTPLPKAEPKPASEPKKEEMPIADVPKPEIPKAEAKPAKTEAPKAEAKQMKSEAKPERKPAERQDRREGGRSDRNDRGNRNDRNDRGGNRNDRHDRNDRGGRNDRNDRGSRNNDNRGRDNRDNKNDNRGGNRNAAPGNAGGQRRERPAQMEKMETKPSRRDDSKKSKADD